MLRASGAVSRQPALSIADDGLFEAISTDSAKIRNDSIDEGVRHRSPSASDDAARSRIGSGQVDRLARAALDADRRNKMMAGRPAPLSGQNVRDSARPRAVWAGDQRAATSPPIGDRTFT